MGLPYADNSLAASAVMQYHQIESSVLRILQPVHPAVCLVVCLVTPAVANCIHPALQCVCSLP